MSKNNNFNNNKNIVKDSKDSNNNYKQIFANPYKTYSKQQQKAINVYLKKSTKEKEKLVDFLSYGYCGEDFSFLPWLISSPDS